MTLASSRGTLQRNPRRNWPETESSTTKSPKYWTTHRIHDLGDEAQDTVGAPVGVLLLKKRGIMAVKSAVPVNR